MWGGGKEPRYPAETVQNDVEVAVQLPPPAGTASHPSVQFDSNAGNAVACGAAGATGAAQCTPNLFPEWRRVGSADETRSTMLT